MTELEKLALPEIRELILDKDTATLRECLNRWQPADLGDLLNDLTPFEDSVALQALAAGNAVALKLFTPFLMDVGFTKTEIGLVAKAVLTSSAIVGGILGGIWMVRLGLLRSMLLFGALQTVTTLAFCALAISGRSFPLMIAATAIENLAAAMGNIAEVALIMALCSARYSAFQYALLSVLALLPRYLLGGPAGWLADHGGWTVYYVVTFLLGLPGLALVWWMRARIAALDAAH